MRRLAAFFAVVFGLWPASAALAQTAGTPNPIELKLILAFGGEVDLDDDFEGDDDMILTLGDGFAGDADFDLSTGQFTLNLGLAF